MYPEICYNDTKYMIPSFAHDRASNTPEFERSRHCEEKNH